MKNSNIQKKNEQNYQQPEWNRNVLLNSLKDGKNMKIELIYLKAPGDV